MKKIIFLTLFITNGILLFSQTEAEKKEAYAMATEAIKLMDEGDYKKSIKLLTKSQNLDAENYLYPYEIAYAYFLSEQPKKAIDKLNEVLKYEVTSDQCYTLLGNIHDIEGNSNKAIEVYEKGLEKHPNSGRLYFERGIVLEVLKKYDDALVSWEKGIQVQPNYPSNYYVASKYFSKYTTEKIWGVIYGELFMNIERGSKRTALMSSLLFNTYSDAITVESKNELGVSFSKSMQMSLPKEGEEMKLPFSMPYEVNMSLAATTVMLADTKNEMTESTIKSLDEIRTRFISSWFNSGNNEKYPNVLFDWHKKIIDLGHFESYNYWVLMKGNEEEFDKWYSENSEKYDKFSKWFSANPMQIDEKHNFSRMQYN